MKSPYYAHIERNQDYRNYTYRYERKHEPFVKIVIPTKFVFCQFFAQEHGH